MSRGRFPGLQRSSLSIQIKVFANLGQGIDTLSFIERGSLHPVSVEPSLSLQAGLFFRASTFLVLILLRSSGVIRSRLPSLTVDRSPVVVTIHIVPVLLIRGG